ncbi:5-formyltetrahydrofolate cyclo-ligase [Planctomycetota bacterium]
MDKALLRDRLRSRLQALTIEQREAKSGRACRNLVSTLAFQEASVIMIFLSLPDEVDTRPAIEAAWDENKTVLVPKIVWSDRHLEPIKLDSLNEAWDGSDSGLRWPQEAVIWDLARINLVVTPGLGFDRAGHRLGRGGAFYDRFFGQAGLQATRCGFGFDEQLVEVVPTAGHDQPVDLVVTDEQTVIRK